MPIKPQTYYYELVLVIRISISQENDGTLSAIYTEESTLSNEKFWDMQPRYSGGRLYIECEHAPLNWQDAPLQLSYMAIVYCPLESASC